MTLVFKKNKDIKIIAPKIETIKTGTYRGMIMGKTVDINENTPHKVSEVICVGCKYRWLAVRPLDTLLKDLECPWCGMQGYVIETGEEINKEEEE